MKIFKLSFYDEFQCTAAECPANCCKGWRIPLDEAFCEKQLSGNGRLGVLFRLFVKKKDGMTIFRSPFGRCPFWGRDGLCRIQRTYGCECMPQICVEFPRQHSHYGFFCEDALYLACPESARLFLVHARKGEHFGFEETEGTASYKENTTNDDEAFLTYLVGARKQLTGLLDTGCRYDSMAILRYGADARDACLNGTKLPEPSAYAGTDTRRLTMDCADVDKLLFGGFYHPGLRTRLPLLYELCRKYSRQFGTRGKRNERAANRKLEALKNSLYSKIPELDLLLDRYYEYYLQLDFLNIYEDYSFSVNLLYGAAKTNILWILLALFAQDMDSISDDQISMVMAVYERRAHRLKEGLKTIHIPTGA